MPYILSGATLLCVKGWEPVAVPLQYVKALISTVSSRQRRACGAVALCQTSPSSTILTSSTSCCTLATMAERNAATALYMPLLCCATPPSFMPSRRGCNYLMMPSQYAETALTSWLADLDAALFLPLLLANTDLLGTAQDCF